MLKDAQTIEVAVLGAMKTWQLAFFIVGLPGVVVGLLVWLTVRNPQRKGAQLDAESKVRQVRLSDGLRFIGRYRATFTCHYLGFSLYAMALYLDACAVHPQVRNEPQAGRFHKSARVTPMPR